MTIVTTYCPVSMNSPPHSPTLQFLLSKPFVWLFLIISFGEGKFWLEEIWKLFYSDAVIALGPILRDMTSVFRICLMNIRLHTAPGTQFQWWSATKSQNSEVVHASPKVENRWHIPCSRQIFHRSETSHHPGTYPMQSADISQNSQVRNITPPGNLSHAVDRYFTGQKHRTIR